MDNAAVNRPAETPMSPQRGTAPRETSQPNDGSLIIVVEAEIHPGHHSTGTAPHSGYGLALPICLCQHRLQTHRTTLLTALLLMKELISQQRKCSHILYRLEVAGKTEIGVA